MKKILMLLLVIAAAVAMLTVKGTKAQDDFEVQISPTVWIYNSNAVDEITVHTNVPYVSVATKDDIEVIVDETIAEVLFKYSDNNGNLVFKFVPGDLSDYIDTGSVEVEVSITTTDKGTLNAEAMVTVKNPIRVKPEKE